MRAGITVGGIHCGRCEERIAFRRQAVLGNRDLSVGTWALGRTLARRRNGSFLAPPFLSGRGFGSEVGALCSSASRDKHRSVFLFVPLLHERRSV